MAKGLLKRVAHHRRRRRRFARELGIGDGFQRYPRNDWRGFSRQARQTQESSSTPYFLRWPRLCAATWPAGVASAMLGATVFLLVLGFSMQFERDLVRPASLPVGADSTLVVIAISLCLLGFGIRVPQRFALWLCAVPARLSSVAANVENGNSSSEKIGKGRKSGDAGVTSDPLRLRIDQGKLRRLCWLVLSVILVAAGLLIALIPVICQWLLSAYQWSHERFVWSDPALAVLNAVIVLSACVFPVSVLGLAISSVHHLSCRVGRWEFHATAWLLFGAGAAAVSISWVETSAVSEVIVGLSALPVLFAAIGAAIWGSIEGLPLSDAREEEETESLPLWSDRWPRLLRAGLVGVGGGSACAMTAWMPLFVAAPGVKVRTVGLLLLALSVGVMAGSRHERWRHPSIGGFGIACVVAGYLVALGPLAFVHVSRSIPSAAAIIAAMGMIAIGFAAAHGRQALLARVAGRSAAGANVMARLLWCAAFTTCFAAPAVIGLFGNATALTILSLSLIALGGTLIIHEPVPSRSTRRARLAALFGVLGLMITMALLLPGRSARNALPFDESSKKTIAAYQKFSSTLTRTAFRNDR